MRFAEQFPDLQSEFIDFLHAPDGNADHRIDRIFLAVTDVNFNSEKDKQALRDFLELAHKNNIVVEFLTGDSNWVQNGQTQKATEKCQKMIDFNIKSSSL